MFLLSSRIKTPAPNTGSLRLSPAGSRCWLGGRGLVQGLELAPTSGCQHSAEGPSASLLRAWLILGGLPGARGCQRTNPSLHTQGAGMLWRVCSPNVSTPSSSRAWLKSSWGRRRGYWGPSTSLTKPPAGFEPRPRSGVRVWVSPPAAHDRQRCEDTLPLPPVSEALGGWAGPRCQL